MKVFNFTQRFPCFECLSNTRNLFASECVKKVKMYVASEEREHASMIFDENESFMTEMNDWIEDDASNRYKFDVARASGVIQ